MSGASRAKQSVPQVLLTCTLMTPLVSNPSQRLDLRILPLRHCHSVPPEIEDQGYRAGTRGPEGRGARFLAADGREHQRAPEADTSLHLSPRNIYRLETLSDPAGLVREHALLRSKLLPC